MGMHTDEFIKLANAKDYYKAFREMCKAIEQNDTEIFSVAPPHAGKVATAIGVESEEITKLLELAEENYYKYNAPTQPFSNTATLEGYDAAGKQRKSVVDMVKDGEIEMSTEQRAALLANYEARARS